MSPSMTEESNNNMSKVYLSESWRNRKPSTDIHAWLHEIGYYRKKIPRDCNSLYKVVSEILYGTQRRHNIVRRHCAYFVLISNGKNNLSFERSARDYAEQILNESSYGGYDEVGILSHFYKRDIVIIESRNGPDFNFCVGYESPMYLYYQADIQHFDLLLPFDYIKKLSFCQSIVYDLLYNDIFYMHISVERIIQKGFESNKLLDGSIVDHNRNKKDLVLKKNNNYETETNWEYNKYRNQNPNFAYASINQNNLKGAGFKHNSLHYRIARGLSPYIYKNVEFDAWIESKNDRSTEEYHDGITLQVGVKCLCKIRDDQIKPYVCHIQALKQDGPCLVFIEELGEKKTVHFNQLKPLPVNEAKPWFSNRKVNLKTKKYANIKKRSNNMLQNDYIRVIKNKEYEDEGQMKLTSESIKDLNNNNNISGNGYSSSPPLNVDYGNDGVGKGILNNVNNIQCLEKYTRIDYYTFKPQPLDYVAMPLTVETNNNNRENPTMNRQNSNFNNYPPNNVTTPCSSPVIPFSQLPTSGVEPNNGANSGFTSNPSTPIPTTLPVSSGTNSNMIYGGNVNNGVYSPYSYLPPMSSMSVPMIRPQHQFPFHLATARPPVLPVGVNIAVQRSVNPNGSDLPYNDVATLRYFFNLGVDCMNSGGVTWLHPPPVVSAAPVGNSNNHNYYYQQAVPNSMPTETHGNAVVEVPLGNRKQDFNKPFHNNTSKINNKFSDFKGGRGGHSRFRRNDNNVNDEKNVKNTTNFQRGHFNNNHRKNNMRNGNINNENVSTEHSEKNEQIQETEQTSADSPANHTYPYSMSYPLPPQYNPYYINENEHPIMPSNYQNYVYGPSDDGLLPNSERAFVTPPTSLHFPLMTYAPPSHPPPYFYQSANVPNLFPVLQPTSTENPTSKN